jgi:hypothetical protein
MICFAKPGLTEDLYIVQKLTRYKWDTYTWPKAKHIHRDNPIFSSERMLHKDYYRKGSVEKKKAQVVSL